jgi:transcriptional regulator with XRE-family HTH domain
MTQRGVSFRVLAARTYYAKSYLHDFARGVRPPTAEAARRLDEALGADGALVALVIGDSHHVPDDEADARELERRVCASDVGKETLDRLQRAVDDLATAYPTTRPDALLPQVRQHLAYVGRLLGSKMTLDEHRRLLVCGGWLSLLAATVHIDLRQGNAAAARLSTAEQLAGQAGHDEIRAWCLETRAWDALTGGNYQVAVDLSRHAQVVAPRSGSAFIQATAQEARAWARMGQRALTREALARVDRLVSPLSVPDRPEHHFRYDPDKALSYTATTLAWAGDPAAEEHARAVIAQLEIATARRPRRLASAQLDLGLALLASGKPDEAAAVATLAVASGRVVPSNWWRATEVMRRVQQADIAEVQELRDAYAAHFPKAVQA